jgi:hypothetical protein
MLGGQHDTAQALASQAAVAARAGERSEALKLYSEAADLERRAFEEIPREKGRTRSILAVSFASMLYKAQRYSEAETALFRLLGESDITDAARVQLRELLEVVWDEKVVLESGFQYTGDELLVALRGGLIGAGSAPLELVLHKAEGFKSLMTRVAEWVGGFGFRLRGRPPHEIAEMLQIRAAQAVAGSYQFSVRLAEPTEQALFEEERGAAVRPVQVSSSVVKIMKLLTGGTEEQIQEYVPQEDYRQAFTRLVRNIVPTKHDAREVEIRRIDGDVSESVQLVRDTRTRINELLRVPTEADTSVTKLRGVLRALHLDQNWVELLMPDSTHQRCETHPDVLDEVVGPMVNRRVIAYGRWKGRQARGQKFALSEIELDEEAKE